MEEPVKKPRRNITANIKGRLNSGAYNKTRNLKRNMRALKEKVREFEKKGELKAFVQARYDATRGLLRRLEELEGPVPVTAVAAEAPEAVEAVEAPAPKFTLKKRHKKNVANKPYVVPEFNPPTRLLPAAKIPRGEYNRSGQFHVQGFVEPSEEEGVAENAAKFGYVPKAKSKKPRSLKVTKMLTEEEIPYLERVQDKYLPLPELYNPFTGVKYRPENDPQPNINSAHKMLKDIMEKAKRSARDLKRREEKKAAAAAAL